MKTRLWNLLKTGLLSASLALVSGVASATTYTAVISGNWSLSATWGGTAPAFTLGANDIVIVPLGVTVTMDQNVTLNGSLSELNVLGTLSALPNIKLNDISGTIAGTGTINVANMMLATGGALTFTGAITADSIENSVVALATAAQITFFNELNTSGVITLNAGGMLTAGSNSNITVTGGGVAVSGGTLALTSNYTVHYTTSSATAGMELTGTGLGSVTINVPSMDTVSLGTNVVMNNTLNFTSGVLKLNGFNLTTSSQINGAVAIAGSALSNLTVNTAAGLATALNFVNGSQNLHDLILNVGSGNSVTLASNLNINGTLTMATANVLNISGKALNIAGNLTGAGSVMVNSLSKLAFTGTSSITGGLVLNGATLGKLTVALGAGHSLTMATDLTVDTLAPISGTLVLNGRNLTIDADVTSGGSAVIMSTGTSDVNVTTANSLTGSLMFSATGDSINNMNVTVGNSGSVKLGSNLIVKGNLNFVSGYVSVGNYNLKIGGAGSITGANGSAYVITNGNGSLVMNASVNKTTTFQVGTSANYLPAQIMLNVGSDTGTIGVSAMQGVYAQGTSGIIISSVQPMVNATWFFQNNIGAGLNSNMTLSWGSSAEVNGFVRTDDYITHYSSVWDNIGDSMAATFAGGLYSVTRAHVTSMSPFAVFDGHTNPLGINEVVSTYSDVVIYPNPVSENLNIKNNTGKTDAVYGEIYNMLGQQVSSFQLTNDVTSVPVSELTTGLYIIRLHNNGMDISKKFSKM